MSGKPGLLLSTFTHIYLSRKHSLPTCLSTSACCTAGTMLIQCFTWHSFTQTCYFTLLQIAERVCVLSFYMQDLLICLSFFAFLNKEIARCVDLYSLSDIQVPCTWIRLRNISSKVLETAVVGISQINQVVAKAFINNSIFYLINERSYCRVYKIWYCTWELLDFSFN